MIFKIDKFPKLTNFSLFFTSYAIPKEDANIKIYGGFRLRSTRTNELVYSEYRSDTKVEFHVNIWKEIKGTTRKCFELEENLYKFTRQH